MTLVQLKYRRVDGAHPNGEAITRGKVRVTPVSRWGTSDGLMTTEEKVFELDEVIELGAGSYRFALEAQNARFEEFRIVPSTGGPFRVDQLTEFNTTQATASLPQWRAYFDSRIQQVLDNGAPVTPDSIIGSTAVGRDLLSAGNEDIARTRLGLSAVDNTADVDKPVSAAVQAALNGKLNTNSSLLQIGALTQSNDSVLQVKSGSWNTRTPAQLRDDMGLDTAANLRARSSHTGTQAISTVSGLQTALDDLASSSGAAATQAATVQRLSIVTAGSATQGLYQRTKPTPTGAAAGLRALARDPLVVGRIWAQSLSTFALGYTDDHGATWVSKTAIPAGPGAGVPGLYFNNGNAWILQGPGSVGQDGSLWRSPYPDSSGNGWSWEKVFDLGDPPAGITTAPESVMRNGVFAADGPNLYLGEYCAASQITGGPSLYYSPDSGQNWSKVKTWTNARHIHEIRVINGVPWVTIGDASTAWTDAGFWAATTPQATVWNRKAIYGEGDGGNTLYGIGFFPATIAGLPCIIMESDTRRGHGPLVFTSQNPLERRVLLPLNMVPPMFNGTMRSLTLTSEGNLMWLHTGESGAVGSLDSICISKGPYFTETVVLESAAAGYPPFGGATGPSDPVEDGQYIWIAGFRIRKELFVGQTAVTPAPVPNPPFVPNPPLTITNQWIAPSSGTDGDAVSSWTPTTGAIPLAQATTDSQPTLVTTSGIRYVRFDGVDDFLEASTILLTQPTTVFFKGKIRSYNGVRAGFIAPNGSGFQLVSDANGSVVATGSTNVTTSSGFLTTGTDFVLACVFNAGATRISVNGGTPVVGDMGSGGLNHMRVGYAFSSGAKYAAIDVREIRIYRQVLTTAQVNTIVAGM